MENILKCLEQFSGLTDEELNLFIKYIIENTKKSRRN